MIQESIKKESGIWENHLLKVNLREVFPLHNLTLFNKI